MKKSRKLSWAVISLGSILVCGAVPLTTNAQSVSDLQAQIQSLLATVASLQAQLKALQGSSTPIAPGGSCTFERTLNIGSRGEDVRCLQKYLDSEALLSDCGGDCGPSSLITGYFGPITKRAVINWQKSYGISPATGVFGPLSRGTYSTLAGRGGSIVSFIVDPARKEGERYYIYSFGAKAKLIGKNLQSVKVKTLNVGVGSASEESEIGTMSKVGTSSNGDTWEFSLPTILGELTWAEAVDTQGQVIKGPSLSLKYESAQ